MNNKSIVLTIVVLAIVGSIYYLESSKVRPIKLDFDTNQEILDSNSQYATAPELVGIEGYLNTDSITISEQKGKVVLIDFWTYSCINCIRTLPYLTAWDEKYREEGLVIIGVHTPEFDFEKDYDNVKDAMEKYNIEYAVVQDNNYATWQAYQNRFWPRKYLIDKDGFIRYDHIGEGGYEETELKIQELLAETGSNIDDIEVEVEETKDFVLKTTQELYAGYDFALPRGQNIGNAGGIKQNQIYNYDPPINIKEDTIYLEGFWIGNSDNLELTGDSGSIILNYKASEVNIVASSVQSQSADILIDGKQLDKSLAGFDVKYSESNGIVKIDNPQLYNVIDGPFGNHLLEIKVKKGFSFNAFTFGS